MFALPHHSSSSALSPLLSPSTIAHIWGRTWEARGWSLFHHHLSQIPINPPDPKPKSGHDDDVFVGKCARAYPISWHELIHEKKGGQNCEKLIKLKTHNKSRDTFTNIYLTSSLLEYLKWVSVALGRMVKGERRPCNNLTYMPTITHPRHFPFSHNCFSRQVRPLMMADKVPPLQSPTFVHLIGERREGSAEKAIMHIVLPNRQQLRQWLTPKRMTLAENAERKGENEAGKSHTRQRKYTLKWSNFGNNVCFQTTTKPFSSPNPFWAFNRRDRIRKYPKNCSPPYSQVCCPWGELPGDISEKVAIIYPVGSMLTSLRFPLFAIISHLLVPRWLAPGNPLCCLDAFNGLHTLTFPQRKGFSEIYHTHISEWHIT